MHIRIKRLGGKREDGRSVYKEQGFPPSHIKTMPFKSLVKPTEIAFPSCQAEAKTDDNLLRFQSRLTIETQMLRGRTFC